MGKVNKEIEREKYTTMLRKDTKQKLSVLSAEKGIVKNKNVRNNEMIEEMVDAAYDKLKKGE